MDGGHFIVKLSCHHCHWYMYMYNEQVKTVLGSRYSISTIFRLASCQCVEKRHQYQFRSVDYRSAT